MNSSLNRFSLNLNGCLSLALASVVLSGGLMSADVHGAGANGDRGPLPTGLWYSASDAGFPQVMSFVSINADGTFTFNSTAETGGSSVFPGEYTSLQGLWTRKGDRIELRGFTIQELETPAGSEFNIVRAAFSLEVDGRSELFGLSDYDSLSCPNEFACPNPDENPLVIGEGFTGGLPIYYRRISIRED